MVVFKPFINLDRAAIIFVSIISFFLLYSGELRGADLIDNKVEVVNRIVLIPGKDFASQITQPNTIYEIRNHFVLNADVIIPDGCILDFNGGSISGSLTIKGNKTSIRAGLVKIFNSNVTLTGTWIVDEAYPEWFGAKGNGISDDTYPINKCLKYFPKTILCSSNYFVNTPNDKGVLLSLPSEHSLEGANINAGYNLISIRTGNNKYNTVLQVGQRCSVENIRIVGNTSNLANRSVTPQCSGISTEGSESLSSLRLIRVFVRNCEIGFNLQCYMSVLEQCDAYLCYIGFYMHGKLSDGSLVSETTSISMKCCFAHNITYQGFKIVGVIYSVFEALGADFCGYINNETITKENTGDVNITHAYFFERCSNIVCNSLGSEICYKFIRASYSQNIIFNSCFMKLGYGDGKTQRIFVAPKNVVQLDYVVGCSFESCKIRALQPSIYLPDTKVCDIINDSKVKIVSVTSGVNSNSIDVVFKNCGIHPSREDIFVADKIAMTTPRRAYRIEPSSIIYTGEYDKSNEKITLTDFITNLVLPQYHSNSTITISSKTNEVWSLNSSSQTDCDLHGKTIIIENKSSKAKTIIQYGNSPTILKNGVLVLKGFRINAKDKSSSPIFSIQNGQIRLEECEIYASSVSLVRGQYLIETDKSSTVHIRNSNIISTEKALVSKSQQTDFYTDNSISSSYIYVDGSRVLNRNILYETIGDGFSKFVNITKEVDVLPKYNDTIAERFSGCCFLFQGKPVWWDGSQWLDAMGYPIKN